MNTAHSNSFIKRSTVSYETLINETFFGKKLGIVNCNSFQKCVYKKRVSQKEGLFGQR